MNFYIVCVCGLWQRHLGNNEIKNELLGLIAADFGKNSPLKWGDEIKNIETKLYTVNNKKSLESVIYPAERVRPLRPEGTKKRDRWTETENELCFAIYKKHGASSLKRNYPMVRDFLIPPPEIHFSSHQTTPTNILLSILKKKK